jgi:phosphatidylserine decarboxylase
MLKKYLPYIFLIAAALLLFFVKKNQRGNASQKPVAVQTEDRITVPAVIPADEKQETVEGFNRNTEKLIFSKHAKCRMGCRKIDESEIREILKNGTINYKKIQNDKRGKTYPVEGFTRDKQHVRIVFAPKDDGLVVVTVIDLGTEWACDCK